MPGRGSAARRRSATRGSTRAPTARERMVVDRRDRLHLARRRGEERLVGAGSSSSVHGALRGAGQLDHARAGDRGEDVVLERRREKLAVVDPEERRWSAPPARARAA